MINTWRVRQSARRTLTPAFNKRSPRGGGPGLQAAVLTNASAGTPTVSGATSPHVTSDQGSGIIYWAAVTNAGSATNAQIKAGSGGNIVGAAGSFGNTAVSASGVITVTNITGLTTGTTYQLLFLLTNPQSQDSAQASASWTTA